MPSAPAPPSAAVVRRLERAAGHLGAAAIAQAEREHDWYAALSAENRSWAGLVAHAGVRAFLDWFSSGGASGENAAGVFGAAPPELARAVTLQQTLQLVRTVVDVVEREATALVGPRDVATVREAILRYSREIAFSAATVYADAAETRGAWDARLESLVVDAVIRGEADDSVQSRAAALGWGSVQDVAVIAGDTPSRGTEQVLDDLHRAARPLDVHVLAAIHGRRLVVVVGGTTDPLAIAAELAPHFLAEGPIVVGPRVPHLFAAGRSARAALSGHSAAPAWPGAPRPTSAENLLGERALLGDLPARSALVARIYDPLRRSPGGHLLATAGAYLDGSGGLEASGRALFVHPNTVRYRLGRIAERVGYDLTDPHDAQTVRLALAFGRLAAASSTGRPPARSL